MTNLLVKPDFQQQRIQHITPENAQWQYVGFDVYKLKKGEGFENKTHSKEVCIVILSGNANINCDQYSFNALGERTSVFEERPPYSVYLPPGKNFSVTANSNLEIAICSAPAQGKYQPRVISPDDCTTEQRGQSTNYRKICHILSEHEPAESLLVVEVITPNGHWSSYPPHKHDQDNLPHESLLEETYYHRLNPSQGYALQRVYTDDRSLDLTFAAEDHDVVKVPYGYHPVGAAHGYDLYYLNVMAGPVRTWRINNDPNHEWMLDV